MSRRKPRSPGVILQGRTAGPRRYEDETRADGGKARVHRQVRHAQRAQLRRDAADESAEEQPSPPPPAQGAPMEQSGQPDPIVTIPRYEVSIFPEGVDARRHFVITVAFRGDDRWAVFDGPRCLGADGEWEYEPLTSARDEEWLATHRFDLDTALGLAREAAPRVTVNGRTALDTYHRLKAVKGTA